MHQHAKRTTRCDLRIFLTQRTGSRVSRVSKRCLALCNQAFVKRSEVGDGKKDFTAHLDHSRVTLARKLPRNRFDGEHVGGDIFADNSVASRCSRNQLAIFVAQVDGEAVDLEFTEERAAARLGYPGCHFFAAENVVERPHAVEVLHR